VRNPKADVDHRGHAAVADGYVGELTERVLAGIGPPLVGGLGGRGVRLGQQLLGACADKILYASLPDPRLFPSSHGVHSNSLDSPSPAVAMKM
jgi:hypothetical protein